MKEKKILKENNHKLKWHIHILSLQFNLFEQKLKINYVEIIRIKTV